MTGTQLYLIEPMLIAAVVGLCFVFENQVVWVIRLFDRVSARVLGLIIISVAAVLIVVVLWLDPS